MNKRTFLTHKNELMSFGGATTEIERVEPSRDEAKIASWSPIIILGVFRRRRASASSRGAGERECVVK